MNSGIMAKRRIGTTDLEVTPLGLGGAPLGDIYEKIPEDRALATVARAAEDPANILFDTAPLYGYGLSEHRFGTVLRQQPRDSFVLSTKVGRWLKRPDGEIDRRGFTGGLDFAPVTDYSYDGAMRAFEQSMMRLGLSRIDILLIHDVDVWTHGRDAIEGHYRTAMEGAYRALDELRRNGDVAAIGVGINESDMCARFARDGDFDCFLLAGRYSLLEQGALDEFLPLCEQKSISVLAGGVFNSGILATGPIPGAKYNYSDAPADILDRVRRIEAVCQSHGVPLAVASAQFPLGHPRVASVVLGAVSPDEVARNITTMSQKTPDSLWSDLKNEGLLHPDAPVPETGR